MYLSRIQILKFRNFSELDVSLGGNVVVVGENRVGKSNLLYALRLIFDPSLPDSARKLTLSDFWDGLGPPDDTDSILVSVEIKDFESDLDVLAILTDFRLDKDAKTVRLTYEFRPKPDLDDDPTKDDDYEFVCYGGESEAKHFGYDLRSRIWRLWARVQVELNGQAGVKKHRWLHRSGATGPRQARSEVGSDRSPASLQ